MRNPKIRGTHLSGALLLALALPLSAQSPDAAPAGDVPAEAATETTPEIPAEDETAMPADASMAAPADEAAAAPAAAAAKPAAVDPALLDAEMLPRASRSLLLDAVRTNAGYFAVGERGHVLSSEDGKTWKQAAVPTRATLTSIATADGVLWAAGHDGVIVHSTDGGQTWTRRRASPWSYDLVDPSEGVPVMDLLFTDATHGFAIGAYSLMLVTTDGGVTWTPRSPFGDNAAASAPAEAEPVADEAADTAAEGDEWTFSEDDLALDAESDPHLNAIARAGSGALVIAGERGTFLRSRDNGETWTSKRLPYEGSMFGVLSWQDDHILVFGLRGNVYESRDLGDTWTRVETGITTSLMGGYALPNGGAILVGANGAVLTRADGDSPLVATAHAMPSGETPLLSGVLPLDDAGYLVIGDKGADLYRPK
ncbi:WD40/YVTN/BNR-like repeat-containing protein [Arenimonas sp. MALMAid1274]|uniref:WD40/YVTN/BNR-like repeat-containing protein n=1 Tax=Arenimonas sp. MALMAid1274 TaxID=3411630 RepID=UPI003B9E9C1C